MNNIKPEHQSLYPTCNGLTLCVDELSAELPIETKNDLNTALMTYHNTLLHVLNKQPKKPKTVQELAEETYPGQTFDTALPQQWVNRMQDRGFDPRGHFVTVYPTSNMLGFYMGPITQEGIEMAARVASMEA